MGNGSLPELRLCCLSQQQKCELGPLHWRMLCSLDRRTESLRSGQQLDTQEVHMCASLPRAPPASFLVECGVRWWVWVLAGWWDPSGEMLTLAGGATLLREQHPQSCVLGAPILESVLWVRSDL